MAPIAGGATVVRAVGTQPLQQLDGFPGAVEKRRPARLVVEKPLGCEPGSRADCLVATRQIFSRERPHPVQPMALEQVQPFTPLVERLDHQRGPPGVEETEVRGNQLQLSPDECRVERHRSLQMRQRSPVRAAGLELLRLSELQEGFEQRREGGGRKPGREPRGGECHNAASNPAPELVDLEFEPIRLNRR